MKRQTLLIILFCNAVAYGQTKKETIDWLNSKLENSPIMISEMEQYTRFLKIKQDGSFSIQSYNYSPSVLLPNFENYRWKTLFTGHFKDLSPNSVRTSTQNGKVFFFASCSNGKCITQENQGRDDFKVYSSPEVLLAVTSESSLEERCKKAFIHLIKICGGKKEAF